MSIDKVLYWLHESFGALFFIHDLRYYGVYTHADYRISAFEKRQEAR